MLLEFGSAIRPYELIDNDVALSMTIFRGLSPLEYALGSDNADQFDMVTENPDFKSVLEACFLHNYKERPSAEELCNHPFFKGYTDTQF